jgi:protoporphyrinogen oxidase
MTGSTEHSRTCIVGGGMLGLALAWDLAKRGDEITILEAADHVGGLADPWSIGDVVWDRHYHVTLYSDLLLRQLLSELDLEKDIRWETTRSLFFSRGRFHPMNNGLDFLRYPLLDPISKVRLAGTILYASRIKDGLPLEDIPLSDWLKRWSGKRTFERVWRPLLKAKLGDNHERASAAFIWAIIKRLYAARSSGLKTERFGYVPGGYATILHRLVERLEAKGVRILTGAQVESVERNESGLAVTLDERRIECERAIVTLPPALAARLCPGLSEAERAAMTAIEYQGIVCPSLLLRKPLSDSYITYITEEDLPFTAVIEMSALVDPASFGGRALVYLPKYVASDDPLFEVTDEEVRRHFLRGLKRMYPALEDDDLLAFKVSRVRRVLPIPTLGYSQRLAPIQSRIPGLYLVNSSHIVNGTLNVNETLALEKQALALLEGLGETDSQEAHHAASEIEHLEPGSLWQPVARSR